MEFDEQPLKQLCYRGGMADTTDLKSVDGNIVSVQVRPVAPDKGTTLDVNREKFSVNIRFCFVNVAG